MLYVKFLKVNANVDDADAKINSWIDTARAKYPGMTVISITLQGFSADDWFCLAVIEYRNDTAIQE